MPGAGDRVGPGGRLAQDIAERSIGHDAALVISTGSGLAAQLTVRANRSKSQLIRQSVPGDRIERIRDVESDHGKEIQTQKGIAAQARDGSRYACSSRPDAADTGAGPQSAERSAPDTREGIIAPDNAKWIVMIVAH
jgi:hypothetical protein